MKKKEEQSKLGPPQLAWDKRLCCCCSRRSWDQGTWFLSFLTCELLVAVNLKLLAAETRRRLSLNDSLAELLVLTDLEVEMAQRGKKT
jgi:hypothetical protein